MSCHGHSHGHGHAHGHGHSHSHGEHEHSEHDEGHEDDEEEFELEVEEQSAQESGAFSGAPTHPAVPVPEDSPALPNPTPHQSTYAHHGHRVFDVAFSPHTQRAVTCGEDGCVMVWDVAERDLQVVGCLWAQRNPVLRVAWGDTPGLLAAAREDGTVRVWWDQAAAPAAAVGEGGQQQEEGDQDQGVVTHKAGDQVYGLAFVPGGGGTAVVAFGSTCQLLDTHTAAVVGEFVVEAAQGGAAFGGAARNPNNDVFAFDAVASSSVVAVACSDGTVRVLDKSLRPSSRLGVEPAAGAVSALALSTNEQLVAAGTTGGSLCVFDLRNTARPLVHQAARPNGGALFKVAWLGSSVVVSASADGSVGLRSVVSGEEVGVQRDEGGVLCCAVAPDLGAVLAAGDDGWVGMMLLE